MIKAVIFDLDDTLYDYEACHKIANQELLVSIASECGVDMQTAKQAFDCAKETVKERLGPVAACHNRLLYIQTTLERLGQRPAQKAMGLYNVYWDTMLDRMKLKDYVLPLFRFLQEQQVSIAILTDLTAHIQHRKIARLGIDRYVDVLVTSEEAGEEKPSSAMFQLVLEKLGLPANQVLMIGDSYRADINGAKNAGIPSMWLRKEKTQGENQYTEAQIMAAVKAAVLEDTNAKQN